MNLNLYKEFFRKVYFYCLPTSSARIKWIRKHRVFAAVGENFFFQPRKLPAQPELIRFHDNVAVATDVTFLNHDVMDIMFGCLDDRMHYEHMGCIEVMDNVFIGGNSTILPDVRIGPNAIVAAGSVVTKDVPEGAIVAGVPAKVIGSFDDLKQKRLDEILNLPNRYGRFTPERTELEWKLFEEKRKAKNL